MPLETMGFTHANAHGIYIKKSKMDDFIEYCNDKLKDINFNENTIVADYIIDGTQLTIQGKPFEEFFFNIGQYDELWAKGIEEPMVIIENIPSYMLKNFSVMGKKSDSAKFSWNGIPIVKFSDTSFIQEIESSIDYDLTVACRINLNEWNGSTSVQLIISAYDIQDIVEKKEKPKFIF